MVKNELSLLDDVVSKPGGVAVGASPLADSFDLILVPDEVVLYIASLPNIVIVVPDSAYNLGYLYDDYYYSIGYKYALLALRYYYNQYKNVVGTGTYSIGSGLSDDIVFHIVDNVSLIDTRKCLFSFVVNDFSSINSTSDAVYEILSWGIIPTVECFINEILVRTVVLSGDIITAQNDLREIMAVPDNYLISGAAMLTVINAPVGVDVLDIFGISYENTGELVERSDKFVAYDGLSMVVNFDPDALLSPLDEDIIVDNVINSNNINEVIFFLYNNNYNVAVPHISNIKAVLNDHRIRQVSFTPGDYVPKVLDVVEALRVKLDFLLVSTPETAFVQIIEYAQSINNIVLDSPSEFTKNVIEENFVTGTSVSNEVLSSLVEISVATEKNASFLFKAVSQMNSRSDALLLAGLSVGGGIIAGELLKKSLDTLGSTNYCSIKRIASEYKAKIKVEWETAMFKLFHTNRNLYFSINVPILTGHELGKINVIIRGRKQYLTEVQATGFLKILFSKNNRDEAIKWGKSESNIYRNKYPESVYKEFRWPYLFDEFLYRAKRVTGGTLKMEWEVLERQFDLLIAMVTSKMKVISDVGNSMMDRLRKVDLSFKIKISSCKTTSDKFIKGIK